MKRTIPFDLFGEKTELCFTIAGIAALERALGKSIQQIVNTQDAGVNFCLNALPICSKNSNYLKKIEEYLDVEGHSIDDIAVPIIHAICASGALGKAAANAVLKIYYPEFFKDEEVPEKNG